MNEEPGGKDEFRWSVGWSLGGAGRGSDGGNKVAVS